MIVNIHTQQFRSSIAEVATSVRPVAIGNGKVRTVMMVQYRPQTEHFCTHCEQLAGCRSNHYRMILVEGISPCCHANVVLLDHFCLFLPSFNEQLSELQWCNTDHRSNKDDDYDYDSPCIDDDDLVRQQQ
jgi:hypothetical protein